MNVSTSRMLMLALLALATPAWACHEWHEGDTACPNCDESLLHKEDHGVDFWTFEACEQAVLDTHPTAIGATVDIGTFKGTGNPDPSRGGLGCWAEFRGEGQTEADEPIISSSSSYKTCLFGPASVHAVGDPHMIDGRGGRFDFRGKDNQVYNLLSAADFSVNARFKITDYTDAGPKARLVHGSFITAAYLSILTVGGRKVQVEFDATRAVFLYVGIDGAKPTTYRAPMQLSFGNLTVSLDNRQAKVTSPKWSVLAKSTYKKGILRGDSCWTGKCFLDLSINPQTTNLEKVAPHGLLGQAFDGADVSVIGKTDEYKGIEITTSAMGEGAIEGVAADYEVLDKFDTAFKYSRWGLTAAAPRDVSKLTGEKVKRGVQVGLPTAGALNDGAAP